MKDVICLAVGQTYDIVVSTKVTAHPDVAPYPRDNFNYLIPIKRGGTLEYLYDVRRKISCLPNDVYKYKDLLSSTEYATLVQYHELRKKSFGYGKAETNYIFYILGEAQIIEQPFEKKGIQVSVKMDIENIPLLKNNNSVTTKGLHIKSNYIYIGITDTKWLEFIKAKHEEDILNEYINFWTPGKKEFKALTPGDLFLFKLHNNVQRNEKGEIVGGAYFFGYKKMDLSEAWKRFGNGNGTDSLQDMKESITSYRKRNSMSVGSEIGCIILKNPFFFEEWIEEPADWNKNIVSGKKYDTSTPFGMNLLRVISDAVVTQNEKTDIVKGLEGELDTLGIKGEERRAYIKVRVNQSVFREKLLQRYNNCCLCKVQHTALLKASHIKPWSESSDKEKLDVENGLLLCPNHDALFDSGFISFDDSGKILISDRLTQIDRVFMNVIPDMKIKLTERNKVYMDYHRKNIFK